MEDGRYKARALSWGLGYTSGDKPQVAVELQVTEGEDAGQMATWYGYFSEASHERTLSALRTMGWEGDDVSDLVGLDKNEVSITLKSEEYKGEWSQKVAWINPLGGVGLKKPMTPEQAKAFGAQMKGAAIASRGAKPASKPKPKADKSSSYAARSADNRDDVGNPDDDIPFIFCDVARTEGERWWRW